MSLRRRLTSGAIALALLTVAACSNDEVVTPVGCGAAGTGGPAVVRAIPIGTTPPGGSLVTYHVGDEVPIVVSIEGASDMGSVHFRLRYTSSRLTPLDPVTEGPFLGCDGWATTLVADTAAAADEVLVELSRVSGAPAAAGTGELVTIRFTATDTGNAVVAFTGAGVDDPQGQNLPASFLGASLRVE